jgi:hypothetical protein
MELLFIIIPGDDPLTVIPCKVGALTPAGFMTVQYVILFPPPLAAIKIPDLLKYLTVLLLNITDSRPLL